MKNVFYFLITLIVVFACGLLPTLATIGIVETELWVISIWVLYVVLIELVLQWKVRLFGILQNF